MKGVVAELAFIIDNSATFSVYNGQTSRIFTFNIEKMKISEIYCWEVEGEITCLSLAAPEGTSFVVAGSTFNEMPRILFYSLQGQLIASKTIEMESGMNLTVAITSLRALANRGL